MRLPNHRSIQFRIIAAFLAALISMLCTQAYGVWTQQKVANSLTLITEGYLPLSNVVARLERDRQRVENDVERLVADVQRPGTGKASPTVIYTDAFRRNLRSGKDDVSIARLLASNAEELAILNRIDTHLEKIDDLAQQYEEKSTLFVQQAELGETPEQVSSPPRLDPNRLTDLRSTGQTLGSEIDLLTRLLDNRIDHLTNTTEATQTQSFAIAAGLWLFVFAVCFVLIGAILHALRPIQTLTGQVQRLAAGDYSGHVEVRGTDEIAVLASEFNNMVKALQLRDQTLVQRAEELKRLSRYLTSVLDSMEESLFVVENNQITLANRAASSVWQVEQGEALPDPVIALLKQRGRHEIGNAQDGLHEVRIVEFGEQAAIIVSADITDQTRTRIRLARSERLALIGQMLAQITHEVRNPLNALSLNTELLREELESLEPNQNAESWSMLSIISSEIERLTALTGHYLQLARRPRAQFTATDLNQLIEEVVHLLQPELHQRHSVLEMNLTDVPIQSLDGNQIRQALINLIRNAIEATSTEVHLSMTRSEELIRIQIQDNGTGMSPEEIASACDPFWSTKADGSGLGLAITKQIIEEHAGVFDVSSTINSGTLVTLTLPCQRTPSEPPVQEIDDASHHTGR